MAAMESFPRRVPDAPPPPARLDLAPILSAIWRDRIRILAISAGAALTMLAITFVMPRWYRAEAVILPPEESDLLSNISMAQRALTKFPAFGILGDYFTPADVFKAVLLSRTVQDEVIREFRLGEVYRLKSKEKTIKELKSHYKVKLNPDGTIALQVEDRSPERAAGMANGFLLALDRYNVEKRNSQARRTREFLERRVIETDSLLRSSESSLRLYQESRRTVAPTGTQGGDLQSTADLMAKKILLEVRLGVLRSYLREDNEQVVQTRNELDQFERRLATLPRLQNDLQRLVRDARVYEQLYLLLIAELEQSRIRETMDTPTVQVLDPAIPPERHSWPKRGVLTIAAGLVAFLAASWWVAARDRAAVHAE